MSEVARPETRTRARSRLAVLAFAAAACIALGLTVRLIGDGAWSGPAGDALYAVLIYLLLATLLPRAPRLRVGVSAFLVCAAIELLQLTIIPAAISEVLPAARWVLGTTFVGTDLILYGLGCAVAIAVDVAISSAISSAARKRARPDIPPGPPMHS